jgi:hypothetical protein
MSGDAAQAAKDATLWKYIGFAATAGSMVFAGVKVNTLFELFFFFIVVTSLLHRRHFLTPPGHRALVTRSPHRGSHQVPLLAQA